MKKTISLMLCLLLIFSSVNFSFATPTSWDTSDQNNLLSIKNSVNSGGAIYSLVNTISSRLIYNNKTAANYLLDIYNVLNNNLLLTDPDEGRQSVTWWVREAVKDLDTLTGTGQNTIYFTLEEILNQLTYFSDGGARQSYLSYFKFFFDNALTNALNSLMTRVGVIMLDTNSIDTTTRSIDTTTMSIDTTTATYLPILDPLRQALTNYKSGDAWNDVTATSVRSFAHRQLITNLATGEYDWMNINQNGTTGSSTRKWGLGTPLGNIALMLDHLNRNFVYGYSAENAGFNSNQSAISWLTLNSSNFTPTSAINGVYSWLSNIQEPIARLAYVHASDEEIEARELAADNQAEVVDNFIDPNGSGAAPVSSFGDVASMSAGYTSNMNTNAQASGIWNIFDSNNFGWFSQETVNQLDTTVSTRKGSSDFDTPLLDQQISDIYKSLGVDVND